ncbi:MAG: SDR family NAD(P)-dependent oxidoreductase [Gemmatimonadales bacterium]
MTFGDDKRVPPAAPHLPISDLAGTNVLVTGASGFIGSHTVRALIAAGAKVHALVRHSSSVERLVELDASIDLHTGDVTNREALDVCFHSARPEVVFHLAADTSARHDEGGFEGIDLSVAVNLTGTLNVIRAAATPGSQVKRVIRTGSIGEYGNAAIPFGELSRERPTSTYSASLVATTQFCQALQPALPFVLVTMRPALVYGPSQGPGFFISQLIRNCLDGTDFEMTGGSRRRDFIYVGDVVAGLLAAASSDGLGGEILNLATGQGHALTDVADLVVRLTGSAIEIKRGARSASVSDPSDLISSTVRAAERLGWRAQTGLEEGLRRTVEWERARG